MKRFISLALTAVLVLGLLSMTGCAGAQSGDIVIGNIQDLSGATSVFGKAVANGAEVAVQKLNDAGGINGRKIKLVTYDTKGDVKEAINAYNRLTGQDKAVAVVGPPISNIGIALAPIANEKKVSIVGSFIDPRVTVKEDGTPQPYMFLMQPSSVQYAEILASYSLDKLGAKKLAVLYDQSNAFSVSLVKPFMEYVKKKGGEIVAEEIYAKGDKDYKTQLSKIKDTNADALYFPNYVQDCVVVVKQAKQLGLTMPIVGGLDFAPPFATMVNDENAADNLYFANNFSETEPQLQEVNAAYKAKFNEEPTNKAYLGYDKIMIIAEAIKRAGSGDSTAIKNEIEKTSNMQGTTGVISISPTTHSPVGLSMVMFKIEKGQYKDLGRYIPEEHKK